MSKLEERSRITQECFKKEMETIWDDDLILF